VRLLRIKYLPNMLRLGAFGLVVSMALMLVTVRAAATHVREGMMSFGREMMQYADQHAMGQTRTLSINGTYLEFASGSTSDGLDRVLTYYQQRCAARDGASRELADVIGRLPPTATGARPSGSDSAQALSTFRVGDDQRGYVACFDVGNTRLTTHEILRRVRAAMDSGDLSEVGRLRYLYAERTSTGRTRFLGFWSDGSVNIKSMFPTTGDAPGEDPEGIARPTNMRRLLSAREVEAPYSMNIYAGVAPIDSVENHFRSEMPRQGWNLIPMPRDVDLHGQRMLTYERGNVTATVILSRREGDQTAVTVLTAQ
jgi:hypothetical protein